MALNLNYSIQDAIADIEKELLDSMMRNLSRHRAEETAEGYNWEQWQALQLEGLQRYKNRNQKYFKKPFKSINHMVDRAIRNAYTKGGTDEEIRILKALKKGFTAPSGIGPPIRSDFFRINEDKLNSLVRATVRDMEAAEVAILRRSNDIYRKVIFNAQVYANTGAGTYEKAIDMATKDMLSAGLQCVEYKNGARHTLKNYASMAIRTAGKRAYLQGEGDKRKERGISTVILNKRGNACPLCAPFVGKVFIDDVWSGGKASDGNYPLLSSAMAAGLYHPNCKDSHTTYFPGISTPPEGWDKEELKEIETDYKQDQRIRYAGRQVERFGRLAAYALDAGNKQRYQARLEEWKAVADGGKTGIFEKEYIGKEENQTEYIITTADWSEVPSEGTKTVIDLLEYEIKGAIFKVDGKSVLLDYSEHEKTIANIIAGRYGKSVKMIPRVLNPTGVRTADYEINGELYDLKTPTGNGKNTIYDAVKGSKGQSKRIIVCTDKTGLQLEKVEEQIKSVFESTRTDFVEEVIIFNGGKVAKVYKRKN